MLDLSELSAPVHARITRVLADAELKFIAAKNDLDIPMGGWQPLGHEPTRFVLNAYSAIGSILCETARQASWSGDTLRQHADRILEWLIADTHTSKHWDPVAVPLALFTAQVHRELEQQPIWLELQQTIRDRSVELTLGQQLKALRDECGWSTAELVKRMHPMNRTAVEDNLEDRTIPHSDNLLKYRKEFSDALNRPIVLDLPRNTSKHR